MVATEPTCWWWSKISIGSFLPARGRRTLSLRQHQAQQLGRVAPENALLQLGRQVALRDQRMRIRVCLGVAPVVGATAEEEATRPERADDSLQDAGAFRELRDLVEQIGRPIGTG